MVSHTFNQRVQARAQLARHSFSLSLKNISWISSMYAESADLDASTRNSFHIYLNLRRWKKSPVSEHACEDQTIHMSAETNSEFIIPAYSNQLL